VAELRDFVVETLHHHHESEDQQLWPLITAGAPALAGPLGDLTGDHDRLDTGLDALDRVAIEDGEDRTALIEAAAAVRDLVHRHLDEEEPLLFPALREHVSEQAWLAFSADVIATAPAERTFLLVALFDEVGSANEVELVLGHLPPAAQELVPALREQGRAKLEALR
jgi:iron-sulfur cluster repair protein YtfE (RIC family)